MTLSDYLQHPAALFLVMTNPTLRQVAGSILLALSVLPSAASADLSGGRLPIPRPVAGYGHPAPRPVAQRPLTQADAQAVVDRLIRYLDRNPAMRERVAASIPQSNEALQRDVSRLRSESSQIASNVSGVRDDLEFHLKKEREAKVAPGQTRIFGAGQVSYTLTDEEASLSPILRFPYDWDQTPMSGVTAASGSGRGLVGVDFYKIGFETTFGPKYTLVALAGSNTGGQANSSTGNGFELGAPSFQGEALFVDVKDLFDLDMDMKAGYFWLPWGREVKGLQRLNPHFNSNSLFYQDGFSQAENQTGLFFQTHNRSRVQYGFGVTTGDKEFSLAGTRAAAHAGNFAYQRPLVADNSDLGYYGSVQGKFDRLEWDVNLWDNGGTPGFFSWEGYTAGFTWGPHRRLTIEGEWGHAELRMSDLSRPEWEAGYGTLVWKLSSKTDAAFRYDRARIRDSAGGTTRITTGRTLAVSHRLDDKQTLIADYSNPDSNPGFDPTNPTFLPGRDLQDDLFKLSYRLAF